MPIQTTQIGQFFPDILITGQIDPKDGLPRSIQVTNGGTWWCIVFITFQGTRNQATIPPGGSQSWTFGNAVKEGDFTDYGVITQPTPP